MPFFIATNSAPKADDSTVVFRLENQIIGALFKKIKYPVRDCLVAFSPALSESTYRHKSTSFPNGGGVSGGSA